MKKIDIQIHNFYLRVYSYINSEYHPKYVKLFADSEISTEIVDVVAKCYFYSHSIPFVAGQIIDYIKVKVKCKDML
jgi:hypothetical protein